MGSNRDRWLLAGFLLLAALVFVRLFMLQVIEAPSLTQQAHSQRTNAIPLVAQRGTIYDRNGNPLATSVEATTIYANPSEITQPLQTAAILAEVLGGSAEDYLALISEDPASTFVYLLRKGEPALAQALQEREAQLKEALAAQPATDDDSDSSEPAQTALYGIHYLEDTKRVYPYGQIGAQVIGSLDLENVGVSGLELMYDTVLRGVDGSLTVELGKDGTPIPGGVQERKDAIDGQDIIISLDIDMQQYVETSLKAYGEERGAPGGNSLLYDASTGEILAAASLPLFDPLNVTQEALDAGATNLKCIGDAYEPGSIFKAATAATALETGTMGTEDTIFVPASIEVIGYIIRDAHQWPEENMSLRTIVARSSNIGTSLVEEKIGDAAFAEHLIRFGFGQPTHVDFPGESTGELAPYELWSPIQARNMSFGQGLQVSSLQMVAFYGAIANDGVKHQPHFLISQPHSTKQPTYADTRIMKASTAEQLTSMLTTVVAEGTGTAAAIEGYTVAGKTGTAEKASREGGYLIGEYIISFVGYLANADSNIVCMTSLDNPDNEAGTGPLFKDIMQFAATRYLIAPDQQPAPEGTEE